MNLRSLLFGEPLRSDAEAAVSTRSGQKALRFALTISPDIYVVEDLSPRGAKPRWWATRARQLRRRFS